MDDRDAAVSFDRKECAVARAQVCTVHRYASLPGPAPAEEVIVVPKIGCITVCSDWKTRSKTNVQQTDENSSGRRRGDGHSRLAGIGAPFLFRRVRPEQAGHLGR